MLYFNRQWHGPPAQKHSQSHIENRILSSDKHHSSTSINEEEGGIQLSWTFCKETKLNSHRVHHLDLSTTLVTEQSFYMSLVSSQLGEVASGGLRVEMGVSG